MIVCANCTRVKKKLTYLNNKSIALTFNLSDSLNLAPIILFIIYLFFFWGGGGGGFCLGETFALGGGGGQSDCSQGTLCVCAGGGESA